MSGFRLLPFSLHLDDLRTFRRMFYVNWTGIDFRPGPAKLLENEYGEFKSYYLTASLMEWQLDLTLISAKHRR
jgi:hypothetical protein